MSISFKVTSRACPLQLEGTVNGKTFYFRARYDSVYCGIDYSYLSGDSSFYLKETIRLPEGEFCSSSVVSLKEALEFVKMTYELSQ